MLSNKNELVIASAGSGKTYKLVNEAAEFKGGRVLITTFTLANVAEIKRIFYSEFHCIPIHVTISPWFTFLLEHCIRPFQGVFTSERVRGINLINQKSGLKCIGKGGWPVYWKDDQEQHYFDSSRSIYSDKASKFAIKVNDMTNGRVFSRLSNIYKAVFIDEVQDLAGFDLEIVKELLSSNMAVLLVGDPRQATYTTHHEKKYSRYEGGNIKSFLECECKRLDFSINEHELVNSKRCNLQICTLANLLYPEYPAAGSENQTMTGHDGIFYVEKAHIEKYMKEYNPIQLRFDVRSKTIIGYEAINLGVSKGCSFDRVIIYPTQDFVKWLIDKTCTIAPATRAKFYVGITRGRYSTAIVIDTTNLMRWNLSFWTP